MNIEQSIAPAPERTQPHVLLVDDDTELLTALSQLLTTEGYQVATADVERIVDLDRGRDLAQAVTWLGEIGPTLPEPSA